MSLSRKIRKNANNYMQQKNRQFLNLPMQQKIAMLSKNGITPEYMQQEVDKAYAEGVENGKRCTVKAIYAAVMIVERRQGKTKEELAELVRNIDREVMTSISTEELIQRQWDETGTYINWEDPIDRIQQKDTVTDVEKGMKKMKAQCDRVLDYMKVHQGITAFEAMNDLGIMRLASRISDLRHKGYKIAGKTVSVKNRFGESCSVKRYSLEAQ